MPRISVERMSVGAMGVNCYLVTNLETNACFIVDPGDEAQRIIQKAGERKPEAVVLTHGHFDHIGAVDEICAHYGIPCYLHEADAPKLLDPAGNVSAMFGMPLIQRTKPVTLQGGESIAIAGIELQILHTPGHSEGSICLRLPENQGVITGDTLFANGYGRTDFADGDMGKLWQSLRMLMRLTPKMITYPGHDAFGVTGRDPVGE